jgi:hypothetical protein
MNNGRVSLNPREPASKGDTREISGFGYRKEVGKNEGQDAIRGNMLATPLNQAYFSPANVQIVQNKLRKEVYDKSKAEFLVDEQSVDELLIVMRAMYLQYGKNRPDKIPEQIAELNQLVADWSVPKIIAECSMHKTYLHDIQNLPIPLAHPVLMTRTGSKSASFDRFF